MDAQVRTVSRSSTKLTAFLGGPTTHIFASETLISAAEEAGRKPSDLQTLSYKKPREY